MRLFGLRNPWSGPEPEDEAVSAAVKATAPDAAVQAREERLAERLLEDEALRGNLDDATWQPIQDWLLEAASRLAHSTTGQDESTVTDVMDGGQATLRQVAQTLAQALASESNTPNLAESVAEIASLVKAPLVPDSLEDLANRLRETTLHFQAQNADPPMMAAAIMDTLRSPGEMPA